MGLTQEEIEDMDRALQKVRECENILEGLNVEIFRLREIFLMKEKETVSEEEINKIKQESFVSLVRDLIYEDFYSGAYYKGTWRLFKRQKANDKKYLVIPEGKSSFWATDVRFNLFRGKKKKLVKVLRNRLNVSIDNYFRLWNKYAGKDNVLQVVTRTGAGNWKYYCDTLPSKPCFLGAVDNFGDETYCSIYLKF